MKNHRRHRSQAKGLIYGMVRGVLLVTLPGCLYAVEPDGSASLIQQTPSCSDFDVTIPREKTPAFRVLLPENITWDEDEDLAGLHTLPGHWVATPEKVSGVFLCGSEL